MKSERQLSIFLENKPGVLTRLCQSFADADINIRALSVSDTVDHAVVRLIVSDPIRARDLLEQHGVLVVETEVLAVSVADQPGELATLTERFSKAGVNVEYAYGTTAPDGTDSVIIFRVDDMKKAKKAMK